MFCEVYLLDAPYHLDRPFDYLATVELTPGDIVRVPFGKANRLRLGVVVRLKETLDEGAGAAVSIKPVHSVAHETFSLSREMLGLALFI